VGLTGELPVPSPNDVLRPKAADVAAKLFEGEAIIMNLKTGMYFSADRVGAAVWELVEAGCSLGSIATLLAERFEVSAAQAMEDLGRLSQQMLDEGLVVVSQEAAAAPPTSQERARLSYEPPTLQRYDDMAELLALDPPMPGLGDWNGPVDDA
jgi:hypothetical protein